MPLRQLTLYIASCSIAVVAIGCASIPHHRVEERVINARQLSLRGTEAMQRGQWGDAEMLLSEAVQFCPTDERMRSQYAETLWNLGARDEAIQHMALAVRLSGEHPGVLVRVGEMYLDRGDLERAADQAERAIAGNRQLAAAWALRGEVFQRRGLIEESLASYHRALSYQEHYPRVQLAIAACYRQQERHSRALATLRNLADGYPAGEVPANVRFMEGLAQKDLGRYEAAVEAFLAAARQGDPSPELLYQLAESRMLMGDPANARIAVRAALALAPQHAPSQRLLAQLDVQQPRVAAVPNTL